MHEKPLTLNLLIVIGKPGKVDTESLSENTALEKCLWIEAHQLHSQISLLQ